MTETFVRCVEIFFLAFDKRLLLIDVSMACAGMKLFSKHEMQDGIYNQYHGNSLKG